MKLLKIIVLLLLTAQLCQAQDTTIVLSTSMLDKATDQIYLGALNGWVFKQGTDTGMAKINIDTAGWKRLRPDQLSSKYADKNGRVEGWFRIKVKFDSSFLNQPIYFDFASWAATQFYLDGNPVATRGNTGENGKAFREYNGDLDPVTMRFNSPAPHILSVHFVGYLSSVPPYDLKAGNLNKILTLGGQNYITNTLKNTITYDNFSNLWLIVCTILSVLFWLLFFQNPKEKNLFWIALYTSAFTIFIYCGSSSDSNGITYNAYETYNIIKTLFFDGTLLLFLPLLLIKVFKRKINTKLILVLIILYVFLVSGYFFPGSFPLIQRFIGVASIIFVFGICLNYIITSWKNLRGAQWAIVAGLIFPVFSFLATLILGLIFKNLSDSPYFIYSFFSVYFLSFPLSLLIYVSMRFKEIIKEVQLNAKKVVELSEEKKVQAENLQKVLQAEVARQTGEIRQTLENLKSTQAQLIQSEKMASLGELTAGIAHEIQNPLNFVNNFSEVNKELINEMQQEIDKGNYTDAKEISNDIKENSEKINHHGKRAGDIVKGMLQHSRTSTGVKEPTDINSLADEYLRLSYHGLRAKDKGFNAEMKTDFDESIGKINIIPQDIGRVLLNLYNNAFYASTERSRSTVNQQKSQNLISYEPTVSVSTKKTDNHVIITVSDNGNGIPKNIVDKIFQPFFTTKPTGQGTGLGLSLSYDIVKAHGGEIKVETEEGEGSEFLIQLPINN